MSTAPSTRERDLPFRCPPRKAPSHPRKRPHSALPSSYTRNVATNLEINRRVKEGITILDLKGRLIVGEGAVRLREAINAETAQSVLKIILNLEHVDYIDSTGLGSMVICYTTLNKAGGSLKLLNLN